MNKKALLSVLLGTVLVMACQKAPDKQDPPAARQNNTPPQPAVTPVNNDSPAPYPVSLAERAAAVKENEDLRAKMRKVESKLIAPATEDIAAFSELLKLQNTGLARLFPRGLAGSPLMVSGEGSYYSFLKATNDYGYGDDLAYEGSSSQPSFAVGFAGVDYGFFVSLGKVDILSVSGTNPLVAAAIAEKSMNGEKEPAWRATQNKWSNGAEVGGTLAKDRMAAEVGTTYVLRSVNENHSDVVVVFQLVRRDEADGSIVIAWKIMKELDKPEMKRD